MTVIVRKGYRRSQDRVTNRGQLKGLTVQIIKQILYKERIKS